MGGEAEAGGLVELDLAVRAVEDDVAEPADGLAYAEIARRLGVGVLGPDTPAGTRLENIARFIDFVGESIAHAAEQARGILCTDVETQESDDQ